MNTPKQTQMEANQSDLSSKKALPKNVKPKFNLDNEGNPKECWACGKRLEKSQRAFGFCNITYESWLLNDLRKTSLFKNYKAYLIQKKKARDLEA